MQHPAGDILFISIPAAILQDHSLRHRGFAQPLSTALLLLQPRGSTSLRTLRHALPAERAPAVMLLGRPQPQPNPPTKPPVPLPYPSCIIDSLTSLLKTSDSLVAAVPDLEKAKHGIFLRSDLEASPELEHED